MLFYLLPGFVTRGVYVAAALLPAVILMRYIYKQDKVEKEPMGLMISLVGAGALSVIPAVLLERMMFVVVNLLARRGTNLHGLLEAFLVAAMVEEGCKLFFLAQRSWREPNFNYWFDGVVYAVAVSLGFAAVENVLYVLQYGLTTAVTRALLSVPGHLCFSVFMGIRYSRAKFWAVRGQPQRSKRAMLSAYVLPVLVHGAYDACLMTDTSPILFLALVIGTDVAVYRSVKRWSSQDSPL